MDLSFRGYTACNVPLLECVPNISEGRRGSVIARFAESASSASAHVADVSSDRDHNRTVLTLVGEHEALMEALIGLVETALAQIDLNRQTGAHPRTGVVDVVPFVPLAGAPMATAVAAAEDLGHRLGAELGLPVYLYGKAARRPALGRPVGLRRLGLEALSTAVDSGDWAPDFGPAKIDPRQGVVLVGARAFLVAFNVVLETAELEIAHRIARRVRASSGGLAGVQALGVLLPSRGLAQVSLNLVDLETTSIVEAFAAVKHEAEALGTQVRESEIVGLVPRSAAEGLVARQLQLREFSCAKILESHLPP